MNELIQQILKWPIIVQGALGSGLFWVLIQIAQKLFDQLSIVISNSSTKSRKTKLITELSKYRSVDSEHFDEKGYHATMVIYRSLRHFYKALIWLTLGLILNSIISVFGIIGFIGCLYYLFCAANAVQGVKIDGSHKHEIAHIKEELKKYSNHNQGGRVRR